MSREAFTDSRLRLQWAKESLTDFERCGNIYFKRTPRELIIEPDPDGIHERHKFRFRKPFPLTLTKHTVRAIEDLRAALDLAACDVARLKGLSVDDVHFPFCKSSTDLKSRINSACKDFPEEIKRLFAGYEPYAGGSDLLFAINELCNASKHKIIVPVASTVGTSLPYIETSSATRPIRLFEGWDSDENEITFAITERGLKWKYRAKFSFRICFGKVGAIEGRDVRDNINGMILAVTTIVDEVEAESRRLGLTV
ncbi:MAG: hypothetical protein WAN65_32530 [Candidatus Sulfotelmatobacter sp.]